MQQQDNLLQLVLQDFHVLRECLAWTDIGLLDPDGLHLRRGHSGILQALIDSRPESFAGVA